jgi:hypothetical protein
MRSFLLTVIITVFIFSSAGLASYFQEQRKIRQVTRVARPEFSPADWDGIYFENLFEQGLVGPRPQALPAAGAGTPGAAANSVAPGGAGQSVEPSSGDGNWTRLISANTLEDEIKAIQAALANDITTPVRFRSDYAKVHRSFSMLSLLFAIVSQYSDEVRWKSDASAAQVSFWQAAANSRVGTQQAFESCRRRLEILTELVRGGKFTGEEKPREDFDWSNVVDRNPLMHRLQGSLDQLKTGTSSQEEFKKRLAELRHESELVAAIGWVLAQENMTDADDDDYRQHSLEMQQFASLVVQAVAALDYKSAAAAVNRISQSCDSCHADWR